MIKKSPHSQKLPIPIEHQLTLLILQIGPRHIEWNPDLFGIPLQVDKQGTILRLRPGLNRPFAQGLQRIWNHEPKIEINRVPKPLAPRASPVWIVKGKQPRLRLLILQAAVLTLKSLRKSQCCLCWCCECGTDIPVRRR